MHVTPFVTIFQNTVSKGKRKRKMSSIEIRKREGGKENEDIDGGEYALVKEGMDVRHCITEAQS